MLGFLGSALIAVGAVMVTKRKKVNPPAPVISNQEVDLPKSEDKSMIIDKAARDEIAKMDEKCIVLHIPCERVRGDEAIILEVEVADPSISLFSKEESSAAIDHYHHNASTTDQIHLNATQGVIESMPLLSRLDGVQE